MFRNCRDTPLQTESWRGDRIPQHYLHKFWQTSSLIMLPIKGLYLFTMIVVLFLPSKESTTMVLAAVILLTVAVSLVVSSDSTASPDMVSSCSHGHDEAPHAPQAPHDKSTLEDGHRSYNKSRSLLSWATILLCIKSEAEVGPKTPSQHKVFDKDNPGSLTKRSCITLSRLTTFG